MSLYCSTFQFAQPPPTSSRHLSRMLTCVRICLSRYRSCTPPRCIGLLVCCIFLFMSLTGSVNSLLCRYPGRSCAKGLRALRRRLEKKPERLVASAIYLMKKNVKCRDPHIRTLTSCVKAVAKSCSFLSAALIISGIHLCSQLWNWVNSNRKNV